uniref:Uncharacterized protein n=1 Tax=Arundo donax TaxID=35708 RepID=A0A0A8YIM6_ARUDO
MHACRWQPAGWPLLLVFFQHATEFEALHALKIDRRNRAIARRTFRNHCPSA